MKVQLDVEIFAVAVGAVGNAGIGSVEHVLEITTETNVLFVPIRANILSPIFAKSFEYFVSSLTFSY